VDADAIRTSRVANPGARVISARDVTACLVTRGDVDCGAILETLPYPNVLIWDARERDREDAYGMRVRWLCVAEAPTEVVYVQDDDCLFRHHDELLEAYRPGVIVSTYGHGENADGLEEFPLMHGGAIMDRDLAAPALERYLRYFVPDEAFYRYCDLIVGGLTPSDIVELPFEIDHEIAARPNRMAHMDGARELKHLIAERVRTVRAYESRDYRRLIEVRA
jgi:hypothetical protein